MARVNEHYRNLAANYLFPEIGRRVAAFAEANPGAELIRLGIGDVTLPLAPAVLRALHEAVDEMGSAQGFRGYGPENGYDFLIEAILEHDYGTRGIATRADEVFVSDGSKQDAANIQEIFGADCSLLLSDPVYPVYIDSNVMAGRAGALGPDGRHAKVHYQPATEANGFAPDPPEQRADLAYLCSPNNPTGSVLDHARLARWVNWARANDATLIFDAAYDAFIQDPALPRSIYEIPGARECAIEMRSFSKRAGFTGLRCAYTVIPAECTGSTSTGERVPLRELFRRRHATKFNGVPYIVQRAAAAVFSAEGRKQCALQVAHYMENARCLREGLATAGFKVFAGEHAPYLWVRTPGGLGSWEFFERLLAEARVVSTPGVGFGPAGEGYVRISAFNSRENVDEALRRITRAFSTGAA